MPPLDHPEAEIDEVLERLGAAVAALPQEDVETLGESRSRRRQSTTDRRLERLAPLSCRALGRLPASLQLLLAGGRPVRLDGQLLEPEVQLLLRLVSLLEEEQPFETPPVTAARESLRGGGRAGRAACPATRCRVESRLGAGGRRPAAAALRPARDARPLAAARSISMAVALSVATSTPMMRPAASWPARRRCGRPPRNHR